MKRKFNLSFGLSFLAVIFSWQISAQDFSEDFENGIPADWGMFLDGAATLNWEASSDGYNSSGAAFIDPEADNIGEANQGRYFLVSPQINVPENAQLRFWNKYDGLGDLNTVYKLMISTAPQPDIDEFIELASWTAAEIEEELSYTLRAISLPGGISAGSPVYIAFVVENTQVGSTGSGPSWTIDEVTMVSACMPVDPDEVEVSDIGVHSAMIYWTHDVALDFEIQVVDEGEDIDENAGESVNTQMYLAEDLEPETSYDIYIKSICPGDVEGQWTLVGNFETRKYGMDCVSPIELENSYSFEGNIMDFPNSFDLDFSTPGSNCFGSNVTENYLNGNRVYFSFTAEEDGLINIDQMTLPWTPGTQCYGNSQSAVFIYDGCDDVGVECMAAIRTTAVSETVYLDNFPVEAGHTYIIVISTIHESEESSVCFEFNFDFVTCPNPTDISYDNLLQNSAVFSWDNPLDLGDQWEYAVVPQGEDVPTSGTLTSEHENVLVDGLNAGEAYDFYVRSICGTEPSQWSNPFPFMTQCAVYEIPYFASLQTTDPDSDVDCWAQINNNADQARWLFEGNYVRFPVNQSFNGENDDYLVSPQINLSGDSTKRLRFDFGAYGGPSTISIYASSNGMGVNDFDQVIVEDMVFEETGWDTYEEKIIVIPDDITGIVNFAFYMGDTNPTSTAFYVFNVNVEEMPACSEPLVPWVDNITATTADIGWTIGYEETQWEVHLSSITDPEPTPEDDGFIVDSNEYTLEDLEPGTQYRYYVRAYCNDEDQSEWVGPVIFNTECNVVAIDIPYEESFNDTDPDTHKFCWSIINGSGVPNVAFQMTEDRIRLQTPAFGFMGEFDEWLISPLLDLDSGIYNIEFDYRAMGGIFAPPIGDIQVLISYTDTDPDSFEEIEPMFNFTNPNFETKSVYYEQENPGEVYIALRVPAASNTTNLEIDNFKIDLLDICPAPTQLAVNEITATSAEISWTAGFAETEWELAIQPANTGIPTEYMTVTDNPYLADDLDPLTEYEVYVRANCDEIMGDSEWIGPVTFTTLCDTVFDTPFLETFENTSGSRDCWIVVNANNDGDFWHLNTAMNPYEGTLSAGLFTGNNGANNDWMISPTINVQANQRIRYYYSVMDSFFIEDLKVFISTDGVDIENFTIELFDTGENTINNTEYKEMVLDIPDNITGEINIAFQVPPYPSVAPYRGQSLFIDNVIVEDIPDCANPINLELTNIQDESAVLSWDVIGDEDTWEVIVIPEDDLEDIENIDLTNIDESYIQVTSDNPYTIQNLDPAQRYFIAVRAICSEDSESIWSEIIELITVCDLEDQCQYTVTLYSDNSMGVGGGIDVIQNEQVLQTLAFPTGPYVEGPPAPMDYTIYVCNGVEFSLFWDSVGSAPGQYPEAWVKVTDAEGNVVFDSGPGIGIPRTVLFTGVSTCGEIDCPQPENLQVDQNMLFTWDPVGDETQWEVAFKPVDDGTLPLSGTIVDSPEYTPTEADFVNLNHFTYDFYVRAVCSDDSQSYWRGPLSFGRGDSPDNAVMTPVNAGELCTESVSKVSFRNTHQSDEEMTCESDLTSDVWIEFTATSRVHYIEVGGHTGNFYISSGDEAYPDITTTLYKVEADGALTEMRCSRNNVITAAYASELEVGENYKVRMTLNAPEISTRLFTVCITTPEDLCKISTVNGDFERPELLYFSGISSISTQYVVPNWRKNNETSTGNSIFIWEGINSTGADVNPYSGIQSIQLTADLEEMYDPNNPTGMFTDMETSELTAIDYSYAHAARGDNNFVQLFAGPVGGPYTMVREDEGLIGVWKVRTGTYEVPEGQDETRFMFVVKDNAIGNVLDLVNFVPNNKIITEDMEVDCDVISVEVEANGTGEWLSGEDNPAPLTFENPESRQTSVSGFSIPGEYTLIWKTRYCEEMITVTMEGLDEAPEVVSPVTYCLGEEAQPLSAEPMEGYVLWFYSELGGEAQEAITPDTSEAGTHIYYAGYESEDGCIGPLSEIEVIINEGLEESPIVESPVEYCLGEEAQPLSAQPMEGYALVFFDDENGEAQESITPDTSEAGTFIYYAAYQSEGGCMSEWVEIEVVVNEAISPEVAFYLDDYAYCLSDEVIVPELSEGFVFGGTFTATPSGLNINPEDGSIDLTNSESGIYTITYTIEEDLDNCVLESTHSVEIEILPDYEFALESYCSGSNLMVRANFQGESPAEVVYHWTDADGVLLSNDEELNFTASVGSVELPANVYLTVEVNGCSYTQEISITRSLCKIPEGISPNGDGLNDNFNLTGMGVKKITIYNRYGTEVYSKENYTNEWYGQSNKGKELPSATYYYVIKTIGGETIQGWVYVNREY